MKLPRCLAIAACTIPGPLAAAQSFVYPNFSSTSGLTLNGQAASVGNALRVTPAISGAEGSVFADAPVIVNGAFDTSFRFQITALSGSGADGLTFVIQNDPR